MKNWSERGNLNPDPRSPDLEPRVEFRLSPRCLLRSSDTFRDLFRDFLLLLNIELLANHAVPKSDVHGGYALADVDALRPSQQRVTDYLRQHGLPL